jgi:hypothetical protein
MNFFSFIARKKDIADYEAIKLYNEWAYEIGVKLREHAAIQWEGVGVIAKNESGDIFFEAKAPIDASLSPVPANRIIRSNTSHTMIVGDKEYTNVQMSGYLNEPEKRQANKSNTGLWLLAAGAVIIIVLFLFFYKN